MREKITPYEKTAQYGGGAARNSQRADNLHGRKPASFVGFQRPPIDGTAALKDAPKAPPPPKRQERFKAEEPPPPIRPGEQFHVCIDVSKNGVTRFIEGVMEVLESMWIFTTWVFKVKIKGIEQFFLWRLDWIMAGRAAWWSRPHKQIGAGQSLPTRPAPIALLPAPHNPIVALLPERVA